MPRPRWMLAAVVAVAAGATLLAGPAAASTRTTPAAPTRTAPVVATTAGRAATTAGPCGTAAAGAPRTVHHVVWVVFENKTLETFRGRPTTADPYLTGLAASCALATSYAATPYYGAKLAMTSGSDWGVTGDVKHVPGPDLFSQLGADWRVYMGDMPRNCSTQNTASFFARHNPAVWFDDAADSCRTRDVPLPSTPAELDLSSAFTWVEGDVGDSMHGCKAGCPTGQYGQLARGDTWASTWVQGILDSPTYAAGDTVVVVVWDQAGAKATAPFIVASPWTPAGSGSTTSFTHYSLLRGTEELLGLPLLGGAQTATSVASDFGLTAP